MWSQPGVSAAVTNNWVVLWQGLRARVPDRVYREGTAVTMIAQDGTVCM